MKILQIITLSEPIGGAQMVLFNNTQAMVENGHDVHIVVGNEGALTERLKSLNVKTTRIPFLQRSISIRQDFKCFRALKKLLKEQQPDIVISHSSKAGILTRLACKSTHIRNIFTVHGWSFTPGVKGIKRYFYLSLEKLMGRFTDHIITVSKFDYELGEKYKIVKPHKMRVIYNGSPDLKAESKEKKAKPLSILMTARFSYQKDHTTLFKALKLLKEEELHVDLVGGGELYDMYKSLAKEMNIEHMITFHGETNQIPKFLNAADIFVLTSRFEGLPLSICEAMSVGLPILASDVGGVSEMVTDGHNGFLLPVENHRLLAKKLKTLIENPSLVKALGSNSRKTFLDKFSIQQMASATEEFINDIIKSKT